MADLEAHRPAPIVPLHKNPSCSAAARQKSTRRVAFTDQFSDPKSPRVIDERDTHHQPTKCRPCCFMCCAWTCLALCTLVITFLVLGFSFYAYVQSQLPEVHLQRISFPNFNLNNSSGQKLINAAVDIDLQVINRNDNSAIVFGSFKVDVFGQDVKLGHADVPGFSISANNMTTLQIHSWVTNSPLVQADLINIQTSVKNKDMVVDLFLTGHVGFNVGGVNIQRMPLEITCQNVQESDVDNGDDPKCTVKVFAFGALL